MKPVFEFKDYREFLRSSLPVSGEGRGARSRLAEALGCRLAFISNVLNGLQHFSLENGVVIAEFLKLSPEERDFFMLLLQHGRAGSRKLERHFEEQIARILAEREKVRTRIRTENSLSETEQASYYGSWIPIALHVMSAVPALRTRAELARRLRLMDAELREPLEFLLAVGILREVGGRLERGPTRLHLDADSPLIRKHHANWRLRALDSLEREPLKERQGADRLKPLHYSLVMSLSRKDLARVREALLEAVSRTEEILGPSPEETGACLNIDLFEI